ncbi:MAG: urease accessory protein UreF, partial [Janthinobacterium lividum]
MDIPTITDSQLVRLMVWLSPSFPTGAFAYSHGLEWAVEQRLVHDRDSLIGWVKDVITTGS